jgi:hypothetical protein
VNTLQGFETNLLWPGVIQQDIASRAHGELVLPSEVVPQFHAQDFRFFQNLLLYNGQNVY